MTSIFRAGLILGLACFGTACTDSTGLDIDPNLVHDTVLVAAPLPQNVGLPTALDVSVGSAGIGGGRFPERSRDALEWDFVVGIRDGNLVLLPPEALGVINSTAAITPAIEGETFEGLRETPGQSTLVEDSAVVMQAGRVYAARTRELSNLGSCVQYSKLEPLEVNVAEGLLRVQIVTNGFCGDRRLVPLE